MAPAPPTDTLVPLAATLARPTHTPASSIGVPATAPPTSVPTTKPAVATATPVSVATVDQLIDSIADLGTTGQFVGAVLSAQDGAPVYAAAYGLASRSPDVPNQTDTRFHLGSMHKMLTAVAILQLVEQGRLSLDGRISDCWADCANQKVARGGYSTVEELLNFSNALLLYRLPSPESIELLLTGKVEVREGSQYAYGFFDRTIGGQRVVGHSGGVPGVCAFMEMYLDSGYTVIVLSNTDLGCFPVLEFLREHPFAPSAAIPTDTSFPSGG